MPESPRSTRERIAESVRAAAHRAAQWPRTHIVDLGVMSCYACVTLVLTYPVWRAPNSAAVINRQDQVFFEYMLASAARAITHLDNPMFTSTMNTPHGVNLMANTSVLGMALPLAPVTLTLGPSVSFAIMMILAFFLTATAWYFTLSRHVVSSRVAAAIGGAFCAFAPGMMSQAVGAHPNLLAQFLVPIIVWRVVSLPTAKRPVRAAVILGLLIAYQFFINEEVLFLVAQALLVCAVVYLLSSRSGALQQSRSGALHQWRAYVGGLTLAGVVAVLLLAYPLAFQFFGPQHYRGLPPVVAERFGLDAASYVTFPPQSLWGGPAEAGRLAVNPTEQNSFFGWPLVILLLGIVIWQWHRLAVRLAAVVALYFAVVSLGTMININTRSTGVPGPWRLLVGLPLFDSVVPARFGLGATVAIGVLLALGIDGVARLGTSRRAQIIRVVAAVALEATLIPLLPHWVNTNPEPRAPSFFTEQTIRDYITDDRSVLLADTTHSGDVDIMRWSAATGIHFAITRGYFLGPNPRQPSREAVFGRPHNATTQLLAAVVNSGNVPMITPPQRRRAMIDLADDRVGLVVLRVGSRSESALRETLTDLLGHEGTLVQEVWIWRVSS